MAGLTTQDALNSGWPMPAREMEEAVLGAIFAEPGAFWAAAEIIKEEHFSDNRNRAVFSAASHLALGGLPFDGTSIRKEIIERGQMESVTYAHISHLIDSLPDVANVGYFAKKVKEEWIRSEGLKQANRLKFSLEEGQNVKDALDKHYSELMRIHGDMSASEGAVHISEPVGTAMDRLTALKEGNTDGFGPTTGVSLLDDKFSFLEAKNVYVVCGGVSAGKSAISDQIADTVAGQGKNVYITCLEMSAEQRAQRFISRRAMVSLRAFQAKEYLSREAERRLHVAAEQFQKPPIYIDDDRGITTMDIMARARRFKDTHGLGLLIIDYLQLVKSIRRAPREQEVSEISGAVVEMAGSLNIPIILVAQLSRTHQHEGREPELRDLRESGRIEQDAFGVIAVYRPDLEESACKLLILKNRQGPLGRREVRFVGEQVRFEEYEKESHGGWNGY